jgi:hypothetical protein
VERVLNRLLDAHLRSVRGSDRPVVRPHRGSRVCDPGFEPFQLSPKGKKLFTQREGDMQSPLTSVDVGPDPDWIPPSTTVGGKVLPSLEATCASTPEAGRWCSIVGSQAGPGPRLLVN